ncbi:protein CHP01589 [Lupinus albus]|uniref:Protein CHP01589 n=1 Tax=Lupinus albus TaxID=3870 RepID=A0A6A4MX11_LUPAL|nr:protein CHP01589 [Lupinus albus]
MSQLKAMEDSSSASYIHLVHRLIEECILLNMNKEECMNALFKHANINPVITSTGNIRDLYFHCPYVHDKFKFINSA